MDAGDQKGFKRGLKFKFIFLINLLVIGVGSVVGGLTLIGLKHSYQDQLQKRGFAIANGIATNSLFAISTEDGSFLESIIKGLSHEPDIAYVAILNLDGRVIAHSNEKENGKILDDPLTLRALAVSQAASFEHFDNSESLYDVVVPAVLKPADSETGEKVGVIRVGVSLRNLKKELKKIVLITVSTVGVMTGIGIFISLFFARVIITPLEQITAVAVRIAQGDFSQITVVASQDEVGVLAAAFAEMSGGLQGMIARIQETSQQMGDVADQIRLSTKKVGEGAAHQAEAAERTSASIEEMNASTRNISESIDSVSASSQAASSSLTEMSAAVGQVASSTTTLFSSVEETASSLVEMSTSIRQAAENIDALSGSAQETTSSISEMNASIVEAGRNAQESAQLSEKVSQDASHLGMAAIEKTIEGMEEIKKTVDRSAYVITRLDERVEHIGKILIVIDEVTQQTGLLALNAAILAAQAGSEGKGFAVVADEVKSLADRTANSTKEITQLIADVQSEAKDAVVAIRKGTQSVEEGVRLSVHAKQSLDQILKSSERSSQMSRRIEQATVEQVKATHHVTSLMEKVNLMVQRIQAAMKGLERGMLNITNASENVRSISQQVKTSTEEQAKGSLQISQAVENVTGQIQQIAQAMNEQRRGNEVVRTSIAEIYRITQLSVEMVRQMDQAVEALVHQADLLSGETRRFKIKS